MIRKIKLIHILLFSFTVTTVVLLGIILGSWRLISSESEVSALERKSSMLSDTVAAMEERIRALEDGSRIAGSFPEIREFVSGDEQVRFRLKNSVRAELAGLVYYETGAVSAYLRTADGTELSACPENISYQSVIPYRVNLMVARDYHPEKPFRQQTVTAAYLVSGHERFDFAREAIRQGVFAYLLKPLLDSEVALTMERLLKQLPASKTDPENEAPGTPAADSIVGRAMSYIEAHYDVSLPLETVAGALYVNKNYLSDVFSKSLGMTFTQYKNTVRIRHAKELIRRGGLSMTEIAQKTGFDSSSRFSKVFHQIEGISPQRYLSGLRQGS